MACLILADEEGGLTPSDHIERIFDLVAAVTRQSKGAMPFREAMRCDGWELRMYVEGLHRLLEEEQRQAEAQSPKRD